MRKNCPILFQAKKRPWIKRLLILLLLVILYYQLKNHSDIGLWWQNLQHSWTTKNHKYWLIAAILLMPINWLLEISKWRLLLRHSWPVSIKTISKSVLAGISLSLVTPNRIGEYGGRAILAPKSKTATILMTTFIGNVCQWVAFICCGWPALMYLLWQKEQWPAGWMMLLAILIPLAALSVIFGGAVFFRQFSKLFIGQQQKWIRWIRLKLQTLRHIRTIDLAGAWLLSLLRLFVYTLQYLLLLWFFNIPLPFYLGISGIFSIYLIQAGIPLPPGLGVITRSELAIWIWGSQAVNPMGVLSATFSLYLINLIIPALLGSWLIVKTENIKP